MLFSLLLYRCLKYIFKKGFILGDKRINQNDKLVYLAALSESRRFHHRGNLHKFKLILKLYKTNKSHVILNAQEHGNCNNDNIKELTSVNLPFRDFLFSKILSNFCIISIHVHICKSIHIFQSNADHTYNI